MTNLTNLTDLNNMNKPNRTATKTDRETAHSPAPQRGIA